MDRNHSNLNRQQKESQESPYNGRKIICDGCWKSKDKIKTWRKPYHSEIYCSECRPLFNSK